jgi:hypothetical protein
MAAPHQLTEHNVEVFIAVPTSNRHPLFGHTITKH